MKWSHCKSHYTGRPYCPCSIYFCRLERNFREAKRLKEEREALTQEGIESQGKLESLLKELAEDRKLLEKAQSENAEMEAEISEKDRLAGTVLFFFIE